MTPARASFVAHTPQRGGDWHDLPSHLVAVAELAGRFGERFGAGPWAYAAGLWHDLGKFSHEFQRYLRGAVEPDAHSNRASRGPDHSTAGAQYAVEAIPVLGHLLAYSIAGHHGGLPDGLASGACLETRLKKEVPEWRHGLPHLPDHGAPELPPFVREAILKNPPNGFTAAFFARMLFSCLVDADFLDTERHMAPEKAAARPLWPEKILGRMAEQLDHHLEEVERRVSPTTVNTARARVRQACLEAAEMPPGLFSLTVPTGGGKTLSSLSFALRHALRHDLDRVIYVIPFTSIIEQNAGEFRKVMGALMEDGLPDPVLEHHSNVQVESEVRAEDESQPDPGKLVTENWDAPLVVTTSVQFYESLFGSRTSQCRKLHNIARSVVILDEVQTLPVEFLAPCLGAIRELSRNYGTSVVLCTATQPAVERRENFTIGLEEVRPIVPEPDRLYATLRRVEVRDEGTLSDAELVERIRDEGRVLCIVNTRRHAGELFRLLGPKDGHFHLSALMVPEHRSEVLREIRERLDDSKPCRVISTQLIEAGVDIDFSVVYRSMAGLDSVAQAAGRCNRSGTLAGLGRTYLFRPAERAPPGFLRQPAAVTEQILALHDDPMSLEAVEQFFRVLYWNCDQDRWDAKGIMDRFNLDGRNPDLPFLFDFATVGRAFQLIEDTGRPVLVPWGQRGEELCNALRYSWEPVQAGLLRRLQRFTVQIPLRTWEEEVARGSIELVHDRYPVLVNSDVHYNEHTGLSLENTEMKFLSI